MIATLLDYYRCGELSSSFEMRGLISGPAGFFTWDEDITCYGHCTSGVPGSKAGDVLYDISSDVVQEDSRIFLPFNPDEVALNLRRERYSSHFNEPVSPSQALVRRIYYVLRPLMAVPIRKHLQRINLRDWNKIPFPRWPVDSTIDKLHRRLLALAMKNAGVETIPFIWFWPDDYRACIIITHDVEETEGRDFCGQLMDIDASFGFYGSYQVVPEERYTVPKSYLAQINERGCEVNVHDLNHDGRLYAEYEEFLRRARRINEYGREFNAVGFRSGALYRNADWFGALHFQYDLSIPNVGHMDPQRGGCCTIMPYFIGDLVELPLTCTQDYTQFNMFHDYSTGLWERQTGIIMANNGLITILVHPDYIIDSRPQTAYKNLLRYLAELRDREKLWSPLPRDVAKWWRQRSQMKLVRNDSGWEIAGEGKERARVAYAKLDGNSVTYELAAPVVGAAP
ncbi:MAG: hypothetical protein ABSF23_04930 [Terracidiphilus sp.]|jgi:hypothetical protein